MFANIIVGVIVTNLQSTHKDLRRQGLFHHRALVVAPANAKNGANNIKAVKDGKDTRNRGKAKDVGVGAVGSLTAFIEAEAEAAAAAGREAQVCEITSVHSDVWARQLPLHGPGGQLVQLQQLEQALAGPGSGTSASLSAAGFGVEVRTSSVSSLENYFLVLMALEENLRERQLLQEQVEEVSGGARG